MITISDALKAHLAQPYQTTCTAWRVTLANNGGVLGFTDLDKNFAFDGVTYQADSGYNRTDIAASSDLSVDNMEVDGIMLGPSIVPATLNDGTWDYAKILVMLVNYADFTPFAVTSITRLLGVATVTTAAPLPSWFVTGYRMTITGADQSAYNAAAYATVTGASSFTYPVSGTPATPATGALRVQYLMGPVILRSGWLGEVTLERGTFKAELRGLAQAYSRAIGELTGPQCRADLFDSRCKVNPAAFTFTGTITGVNPDGTTLYDTGRTQPGPPGGIAITGVTNANPGVVTLASAPSPALINHQLVVLSGIVGPDVLNTLTVANDPSGVNFNLSADTTSLPVYVSGGLMTPLGSDSGYFDYGKITFTSGLCNEFSMEIKSYVPGVFILELPMPYAVAIGDTYTVTAGCNKFFTTCVGTFANGVNFRGEKDLPGLDKLTGVGKQP